MKQWSVFLIVSVLLLSTSSFADSSDSRSNFLNRQQVKTGLQRKIQNLSLQLSQMAAELETCVETNPNCGETEGYKALYKSYSEKLQDYQRAKSNLEDIK